MSYTEFDMHELTRSLHTKNDSKIVLLVADGLGGLPIEPGGPTELEAASTPHLDALVKRGVCGGSIPVKPGIAPGSGPGHLGLFGYDPLRYVIGRGALEATGIGFELGLHDVAVRGNYCTLDAAGKISDRRAGRIASEESAPLADKLNAVKIPGVEVFVRPVKEHRFVVVFRGQGLGGDVADTDPQATGVAPLDPIAKPGSEHNAGLVRYAVIDGHESAAVKLPLPLSLERGVDYRVRMSVQDDHFITYLNGQVISSWTDSVLKRGGVGFFEDQSDPQDVAWVSLSERDSFMGRMLAHFSLFVIPGR